MTNIVEITLDLGGHHVTSNRWGIQSVYGEIVSEGRTENNEEYIIFKDAESEEPHKIFKRRITKIANATPSTTELSGG